MNWDPDLDLDHGVLRNRLKITDPRVLAAVEAELTTLRIVEIEQHPIPGRYDLPHLQHMHWSIFWDLYFFAGRVRTVRLGKGGQGFCPPEQIDARAAAVFDERAAPGHLRDLGRVDLLDELTRLLADGLWLHPFREGNGRSIRTFLAQLCAEAGWRLLWTGLDRDRNRAAARAEYEGDRLPLRALLDERVERLGRSDEPTSSS